jgi:hypothetical protein
MIMKKLFSIVFILSCIASQAQDSLLNKYTKPNNTFGFIYNRIYTPYGLTLPRDTFPAPEGSLAWLSNKIWIKDTTWKIFSGTGGGITYSNGWGLGLSGYAFHVDSSLVPTIWFLNNGFYTKSEINAFFSGVTPIGGYNKANWDGVYASWAAAMTLSPAGWATQSALVDSAAALRAIIASGGFQLLSNLSTNTSLGTSNTLYPSQNAVKVYADTKEATFTETVQEFTSSTSLTLTLSNTLKTSKAVMVFYNGLPMDAAAFSASGTTVTLSGLTRETTDKIKVKYSY